MGNYGKKVQFIFKIENVGKKSINNHPILLASVDQLIHAAGIGRTNFAQRSRRNDFRSFLSIDKFRNSS